MAVPLYLLCNFLWCQYCGKLQCLKAISGRSGGLIAMLRELLIYKWTSHAHPLKKVLEGSKFFLIGDEYELAKLVEEWLHKNHPDLMEE